MKYDKIRSISDRLDAGKLTISDLEEYKVLFKQFATFITEEVNEHDLTYYIDIIEKFLRMCYDYYIWSNDGDVLITDRTYDMVTNVYKRLSGNSQIIYTTREPLKSWNERKHIAPNMVGSIEKVYTYDDAYDFVEKTIPAFSIHPEDLMVIFSPKYDGASVALTFDMRTRTLIAALTRKDGVFGQDITELVKDANLSLVLNELDNLAATDGFVDVKCEILVSTEDFDLVNAERRKRNENDYKNRRAAASAISANPSNIHLAKYLTIMPLVMYARHDDRCMKFSACEVYTCIPINKQYNHRKFVDTLSEYSDYVRDPKFPYRADGVVITVAYNLIACQYKYQYYRPWDVDIMSDSIAYKCNTQTGITRIIEGYLSIGRTGKATPMIKVEPCDVNETVVTDVNLSNFKKVKKLDLHIGDAIEIESAGDVIPMVSKVVSRDRNSEPLKFSDRCPHCGNILKVHQQYDQILGVAKSDNFDLYCNNPNCTRVIAGKLANFLEKMGADNISDGVLTSVVELLGINKISQLFSIQISDLANADGWGDVSATEFVNEIERIRNEPTPCSRFIGSLGIPSVSLKKSKKLLSDVSMDTLLQRARENPADCIDLIMDVDGFSYTTAVKLIDFITENYDEIRSVARILNLKPDENRKASKGNVVMTGFRDASVAERIEELGFENSDTVNKETVAVIAASTSTGKAQKAIKKGIPIFKPYEVEDLIANLKKM
jgi:DNA ligase (NAD+)